MPTKDFSGSRGGRILGPFGKWKIKTEQGFPGYRAPRWGSSEPHLSPTWEQEITGIRSKKVGGAFGKWKIKTEQEFPGYRAPRWGSSEPHLSPTWEQEITGIRSKKVPGGGIFSRKKVFPGESHIFL